MEQDVLRLECLKLAVLKTANQQEILAKAQEYVHFILYGPKEETVKSAGNVKPL